MTRWSVWWDRDCRCAHSRARTSSGPPLADRRSLNYVVLQDHGLVATVDEVEVACWDPPAGREVT